MLKEEIYAQIRAFKENADSARCFQIPILGRDGVSLGSLVCVDRSLVRDSQVVDDLTQWRSLYMQYFLTQFDATQERTAAWLNKTVLPSDDRILFLIYTAEGEAIGNLGVCNISPEMGEIDNMIRGRKGGAPHLMFFSELAIINWMFGSLNIQAANLHVFSNNARAIKLYESVGFSIHASKRLSRIIILNEIRYLVELNEGETVDFQYVEMLLSKDTFSRMHPWIAHSKVNL